MDLSRNVIRQFVEVTTPKGMTSNDNTVYGTIVDDDGSLFVKIDGSDSLTPVSSNVDLRADDRVIVLLKNHEATVLGSPTAPAARQSELIGLGNIVATKVDASEITAIRAEIGTLEASLIEADKAIVGDLEVERARISDLEANSATIGDLDVERARISDLEANSATIGDLEAERARIDDLEAGNVEITGRLVAAEADIVNLEAETAKIGNLEADVGNIETLIFGSASGTVIQTEFSNAVIAQLGNAQIKSAMIESLAADKIMAGDIITNNVRVLSEDGKLLISDETIQISDETRVRVQIGKDASNDYSINVWDADGKLMFSQGGITDAAIKDAIIRDDMVSDTANIKASKLDISSLFTEINNSTETINSNKVLIDTDAGTLDVAFTKMETDISGLSDDVSSQGTALSVVQDQISSKVWQQDIDDATGELNTQYSELKQTVNGISNTVASHTTQIESKADGSTVTAVSDKVSKLETNLNEFKSTVSETYATNTALSTANTAIQQNKDAIALKASKTDLEAVSDDLANNYYTKTQTDAEIVTSAEAITSSVQESITDVDGKTDTALTQIQQLSDAITNMVVNSDGKSTATQTSEGWTFAVSDIPDKFGDVNAALNELKVIIGEWSEAGTVSSNIETLFSVLNSHGETLDWVTIGTFTDDDGEELPCIELGESDSDYKVVITNKAIFFKESGNTPTKIQDNTLVTSNIRIDDEFRQGDFVWTLHNGNYGLIYRG